jgi:hypothetical protein
VYNKPNGCSATGALAPVPDHQQQQHYEEALDNIEICASTFAFASVCRCLPIFKPKTLAIGEGVV